MAYNVPLTNATSAAIPHLDTPMGTTLVIGGTTNTLGHAGCRLHE